MNYYFSFIKDLIKRKSVVSAIIAYFIYKLFIVVMNPVFISLEIENALYSTNTTGQIILSIFNIIFEYIPFAKYRLYYEIVLYLGFFVISLDIYSRLLEDFFYREVVYRWYQVKFPKFSSKIDKDEITIGYVFDQFSNKLRRSGKSLVIGLDGMVGNFLITGSIGTGKTAGVFRVILFQLLSKHFNNPDKKYCALILDVKGNLSRWVIAVTKLLGRTKDLKIIKIGGEWCYNPLDKPNLLPLEIANRCKEILETLGGKSMESFWIDKARDYISESIKIIRIYNSGYVNMFELKKFALDDTYQKSKLEFLKVWIQSGKITNADAIHDYETALEFFKEMGSLAKDGKSYIISEITRITDPFISSKDVMDTFSPSQSNSNFKGFETVIDEGQIVCFSIASKKYPMLSKIIAAYLKLDYQNQVLSTYDNPSKVSRDRVKVLACDEHTNYVTKSDGYYNAESREIKGVSIYATQSFTDYLDVFKDEATVRKLTQNVVNKIFLRTDDKYSANIMKDLIGQFNKTKYTETTTESAQRSDASYAIKKVVGQHKNINTSIGKSTEKEFYFTESFLTKELNTGQSVSFLFDGQKISYWGVVHHYFDYLNIFKLNKKRTSVVLEHCSKNVNHFLPEEVLLNSNSENEIEEAPVDDNEEWSFIEQLHNEADIESVNHVKISNNEAENLSEDIQFDFFNDVDSTLSFIDDTLKNESNKHEDQTVERVVKTDSYKSAIENLFQKEKV